MIDICEKKFKPINGDPSLLALKKVFCSTWIGSNFIQTYLLS